MSVCKLGPFAEVAFVAMPVEQAIELLGDAEIKSALVVEGVMRDLEGIAARDQKLAGSSYAGAAIAMALEMENPYNSATSKSMCAGKLQEAMDRLRELMPPEETRNELDDLRARRQGRLAGQPAS